MTVFAVNRSQNRSLPLEVALHGAGVSRVAEHSVLTDADPDARNTSTEPDRVVPHPATGTTVDGEVLRCELVPLAWNMIRLLPDHD